MQTSGALGATLAAFATVWSVALCMHRSGRTVPWALIRFPGIPVVFLRAGAIQDCALFRCRSLPLEQLQKIEYAYQAVVGFAAVWIFTSRDGVELTVPPYRPGLFRLLVELESRLPGFSLATWKQAFAAGDVEDTLLLWEAKP